MKTQHSFLLLAALLSTSIGSMVGCGGGPLDQPIDQPITSAPLARPPARPISTSTAGLTRWYAVRTIRFGISDREGKPSPTAWSTYGYDLDGRLTSKTASRDSVQTCKRRTGSPTAVLTDGEGGIDNNFGQHVMSVFKSLKVDIEDETNADIAKGGYTILLRLDNVGPRDNAKVPGALYVAGPHDTVSSSWLIDSKSIELPSQSFPNGYMRDGVWVSGELGSEQVLLPLPVLGSVVTLNLDFGVITMPIDTDAAAQGTIAGAIPADRLARAITPKLKAYDACPGEPGFQQLLDTIGQSSDLLAGTNAQDPSLECDAISVGLGFVAVETKAPKGVGGPVEAPKSICK